MKILKFLKDRMFLTIGISIPIVAILVVIVLFCINKYSLEINVKDGETIHVEYSEDAVGPDITATYKGTIFNKKGTDVKVSAEGNLDLTELGTYDVTYKAEHEGLSASVNVTVIVEDTTAPVIELVSSPDYYTSPVATYVEEGFTAVDNYDGDVTDLVVREEADGKVTYTVADSSGNTATVQREIVYKDVVQPVITLNGGNDVKVGIGTAYADAGYQATDDCDGDITANVTVEGTVDTTQFGTYTVKYKVADSSGNICEVTRNVQVADLVAPTISLVGKTSLYIKLGDTFTDAGYSAADNIDGDITSKVTVTGSVNTSAEGSYTLTYQVTDSSGNVATATRSVYVFEAQKVADTVNPGSKVVYLTFDDGPSAYTEKLLNILDKYGVKVTFFVTNQRPAYQNMIGEAYRRGHTIALHTYSHQYSIYTSEETYYNDLKLISDIVLAQTGVQATIVRFPGGTSNTVSKKYCKGIMTKLAEGLSYRGYLYCDWNVSSGDAGGVTTAEGVATNVINGISSQNVSIVLQHDIKEFSVDAVEQILAWGLANGYTFLPMDENTPMVHMTPNN